VEEISSRDENEIKKSGKTYFGSGAVEISSRYFGSGALEIFLPWCLGGLVGGKLVDVVSACESGKLVATLPVRGAVFQFFGRSIRPHGVWIFLPPCPPTVHIFLVACPLASVFSVYCIKQSTINHFSSSVTSWANICLDEFSNFNA
jgi:hypothetical protein